jgi:hypothetical protein
LAWRQERWAAEGGARPRRLPAALPCPAGRGGLFGGASPVTRDRLAGRSRKAHRGPLRSPLAAPTARRRRDSGTADARPRRHPCAGRTAGTSGRRAFPRAGTARHRRRDWHGGTSYDAVDAWRFPFGFGRSIQAGQAASSSAPLNPRAWATATTVSRVGDWPPRSRRMMVPVPRPAASPNSSADRLSSLRRASTAKPNSPDRPGGRGLRGRPRWRSWSTVVSFVIRGSGGGRRSRRNLLRIRHRPCGRGTYGYGLPSLTRPPSLATPFIA